jgi:hypothetical protein
MFDEMHELMVFLSRKQQELALQAAEWLYRTLRRVTSPPTPVYIPKHPMTPEELERVRPPDAEEE